MEPSLDSIEPSAFPEPSVWPTWEPFTRGEYALTYDPSYTPAAPETETETEPPKTKPEAPLVSPGQGL